MVHLYGPTTRLVVVFLAEERVLLSFQKSNQLVVLVAVWVGDWSKYEPWACCSVVPFTRTGCPRAGDQYFCAVGGKDHRRCLRKASTELD